MPGPSKLRILIAAYYFPPSNVVGASRVSKFVKYLLRRGVEIDVVTVDASHYGMGQDTAERPYLSDPNLRIFRTGAVRRRVLVREEGIYWLPYLLPQLMRLCRGRRYDAFFITGNPFFSFAAAPMLKRRFGLPYILDFRDPWSMAPYRRPTRLNRALAGLIGRVEASAVGNADVVLNVTEQATALYRDHYTARGVPAQRFVTIPNGVDAEDLAGVEPRPAPARFTLVYAGKFGGFRDPRPFFEGLRRFSSKHGLGPSDIHLVHVGQAEPDVLRVAEELGMAKFVTNTGHVPYREALGHIAGASVGLLISGGHAYEPTTKVFDYIGLGRRILALAPRHGFLFENLAKYPPAVLVENTADGVFDALTRLQDPSFVSEGGTALLPQFSRQQQADQLYDVVRTLAARGAASPGLSSSMER
jgi:glycosyltransferase involved in cell wall biosynthesis